MLGRRRRPLRHGRPPPPAGAPAGRRSPIPGVDGVLGSPDVLEELALLGALDGKLAFGTMNRGGIMGARWELDDRMTAYDAEGIAQRRPRRRQGAAAHRRRRRRHRADARGLRPRRVGARPAAACRSWSSRCRTTSTADGAAKLLDDDDKLLRAVAVAAGHRHHVAPTPGSRCPPGRDVAGMLSVTTLPALHPRRRARPRARGHVRRRGSRR